MSYGYEAALRRLVVLVGIASCACFAPSAWAQKGIPGNKPDAGWEERDYLLHYAQTVCVHASYATLEPKPTTVLDALAQEAWAMVELSGQEPAVYDRIHRLATEYGRQEAPSRALAGCAAWTRRNAATVLEGANLPG